MFEWLNTNHNSLEAISQVVLTFVAVVAAVAAFWQVRINREVQREATATDLLRAYVELGIQYPIFANPNLMLGEGAVCKVDFDNETIDGDREKFEQYEWFITMLLLNTREVLDKSDDNIVREIMRLNVQYHKGYLEYYDRVWRPAGKKPYLAIFGREVSELVTEVARSPQSVRTSPLAAGELTPDRPE